MADPRRFLRADLREDRATYTRPVEPEGLARLHMNEAAHDWPKAAREAWLSRLADTPLHTYPETEAALTRRLEARMGAPEGGVMLGSSSGALLDFVAMAGLAKGDRVAFPDPGFSLYPMIVKRHRGVSMRVPVGRGLPLDGFLDAAKLGARQLWLTLPNNPTGAWRSPDDVRPLLDAIAAMSDEGRDPPLVVLDEAYAEFASRTFRLVVDRYENVVLLRTFSKALASAGLRLGALVGPPALLRELSAVKLPYSISTPQLVALDVALDHAALFDEQVRITAERRDRLFFCLREAEVPVSDTASNFVHVATDVADALAAKGILARRLPASEGTRISVGTEAVCAIVAEVLGAKLPAAQTPARVPLLVLDVDGVMIEAEASFREAVRLALVDLRPQLPWDDALFRAMKRLGGMNNDFRLAAGLLALDDRGHVADVLAGRVAWNDDLEAALGLELPEASRRVAQHYEATKSQEVALITQQELRALAVPYAILTGRSPHELLDAFLTLGFECEAVCDSAPHLAKPAPGGLLQLADAFRATDVVFVGDTKDDRTALVRASALRPETRFVFAAIGPDRDSFARPEEGDLVAPTLRELLQAPIFRTSRKEADS